MENTYYKKHMTGDGELTFYVCDSNELDPYKEIKEISILFHGGENQFDGDLSVNEAESLIKYLTECVDYVKAFNSSTP